MKTFSRVCSSWKLNAEEAFCVHRVCMKSAVTVCIRILLWVVWLMVATKLLRQKISWLFCWSILGWIVLWCCRYWTKNQLIAESNAVTGKQEKASFASVLFCFPRCWIQAESRDFRNTLVHYLTWMNKQSIFLMRHYFW